MHIYLLYSSSQYIPRETLVQVQRKADDGSSLQHAHHSKNWEQPGCPVLENWSDKLIYVVVYGRGPQPPGHTAGGEWKASEQSFICHSPTLLISHITAWTISHPTPSHGKIVFHETGPWCQKG